MRTRTFIRRSMGLGDVIISEPLVRQIRFVYPDHPIVYVTSKARSCSEIVTYFGHEFEDIMLLDVHEPFPYRPSNSEWFIDLDRAIHTPNRTYFETYCQAADIAYAGVVRKEPRLQYGWSPQITKPYVVIAPEASGWKGKEWPLHKYAALARRFEQAGITVVEPGVHKFVFQSEYQNIDGSLDVALNWIKYARLFVGGDCGLMHVAAAFGVPCCVPVGSVLPSITSEFKHIRTVSESLPCIGCSHGHFLTLTQPECVSYEPFACMKNLSVDMVWALANEMLSRGT